MKQLILTYFIILFSAVYSNAQDLVVTSKIEGDSISIKWLPNNFKQFKLISNGATVSRIETSDGVDFKTLDYTSAKIWNIDPVKKRYDAIDLSSSNGEKFQTLLAPLFESSNSAELQNFSFGTALIENIINPNFQYVLGNLIVDKEFNKKSTYVYKIVVKGITPEYLYINPKKSTQFLSIDDLELTLDQKKTVDINWAATKYESQAFGFDIEHSIDEISEGEYLTETPFLPFTNAEQIDRSKTLYRDEPEPGHFHYYRMHGRDMFGHQSLISEWKKIYVPLLINAWVEIDSVYAKRDNRVVLGNIHLSNKNANINQISLFRSEIRDGTYEVIETVNYTDTALKFSFNEPTTGDHYYYKIALINKDDSVFSAPRYLFTLDQTPPAPPTKLQGEIDSNGVVKLAWTKPLDKDILGYRVFRANSKNEEFIEKTTRLNSTPIFVDTLQLDNLTSEVFYTIISVDSNYNQSFKSDTILVLKPDTIAPIPCVILDIKMDTRPTNYSPFITWVNSDSRDVKMNYLIRNFQSKIDTLYSWNETKTAFTDTLVLPGNYYNYQIVTEDKNGNISKSQEYGTYFEPGFRNALSGFKSEVDLEKKSILLTWKKPTEDVYSYQIYRAKGDGKLLSLKTITDGKTVFKDKNVRLNTKYRYTIKYINEDGIHSLPVQVEVIYQ